MLPGINTTNLLPPTTGHQNFPKSQHFLKWQCTNDFLSKRQKPKKTALFGGSPGNFAPIDSQMVGACLVVDPEDATQEIEGSWILTVARDGNPEVATC